VIVGILAVALVATLFSLWYHIQNGRRALAFWSADTAMLIARAPEIDAIELVRADEGTPKADAPAGDSATEPAAPAANSTNIDERPVQRFGFGGKFYQALAVKDASQARGVSNIRRALVLDVTYQWDAPPAGDPVWEYALEFRDGPRSALVLFDFSTHQVGLAQGTTNIQLDPAANDDWRKFFVEQLGERRK
jgi:hypothetical protein